MLEGTLKTAQSGVHQQYLLAVVARLPQSVKVPLQLQAGASCLQQHKGSSPMLPIVRTVCAHPALQFQLSLSRQSTPWYFSRRLSMV